MMQSKLKTTSLAFVLALTLTAAMVPTASAQFTSSADHTIISGFPTAPHKFTAGSGIGGIECVVNLAGTAASKSESTWTVTPTIGSCFDSFGRTVHVTKNTLEYHYLSGASKGNVTLTGDLVLTVTSGTPDCTITTKGHQLNTGITYKNLGGTSGVELTTNVDNITATVEGGFFACGTSTTTNTAGTTTGKFVLIGKDTNGNAVSLNVD